MTPDQPIIYKDLLALLCDVSREKDSGLGPTLAEYSKCAPDIITSLRRSSQFRKPLIELGSSLGLNNNERFREALEKDEERLLATLPAVIHPMEPIPPGLTDDDAQHFLDVLHTMHSKNLAPEHRMEARRMIRRLSEAAGKLPSAIFITGVTGRDRYAIFGGGFADVYRASYQGKAVALKRLREHVDNESAGSIRLKFCQEALVWQNLDHPHVLRLIGIDRDTFSPSLCMVLPWMGQGKIEKYLESNGRQNVQKLLCEVAQGLEYLHSQNVVHGDLRGDNILITDQWTACLADFGLSLFSDLSGRLPTRGGNVRWMAPELIAPEVCGLSDSEYVRTFRSDVYAFGCVCVELYTGRPPFSDSESTAKIDTAVIRLVLNGDRPERPTGQPAMSDRMWQHVESYWGHDPTSRPDAQTVVQHMSGLIGA
ncbi:kinase-like domain-containing protein [Mycena latifolia]|nr:kinase-like domain-containing protein [Mycena latifolia]KAJ7468575.1 kinase-like domain-containing protein [Mycena latifolia]